jgi:hypothetical protein
MRSIFFCFSIRIMHYLMFKDYVYKHQAMIKNQIEKDL